MDISTFSSRTLGNDTTCGAVEGEELRETYRHLRTAHEALVRAHEVTRQELHEAQREHRAAAGTHAHLAAEFEALQVLHARAATEYTGKLASVQEELAHARSARSVAIEQHDKKVDALESRIKELEERASHRVDDERLEREVKSTPSEVADESTVTREERDALSEQLAEHMRRLSESCGIIASLKEQLSVLSEELTCTRSNLSGKKDELESATEALHATQAELLMTNTELQRMKNEGSNHAAKGNSLFAEVEDKRQEMAKTLIQMKQYNVQLKRELGNKQAEVDALLCEKKTLWEEYAGMAIHHDAELIKSYEQRITDLCSTVGHQRKELVRWFSKYYEPGTSQATEWVGGVLAHLKNRSIQLSDELLSTSIDNLSKASQIRDLHKQVGSWRLKALEASTTVTQLEKKLKEPAQKTQTEPEVPAAERRVDKAKLEMKQEVKLESLNSLDKEMNRTDKFSMKKEKTVNDVKKKVTF